MRKRDKGLITRVVGSKTQEAPGYHAKRELKKKKKKKWVHIEEKKLD